MREITMMKRKMRQSIKEKWKEKMWEETEELKNYGE